MAISMTTGSESLDELLEGGLCAGDNVVWIVDRPADSDAIAERFLAAGDRATHVCVGLGPCPHDVGGSADRRRLAPQDGPDALVRELLEVGVDEHRRVEVRDVGALVAHWGAATTVDVYRRACPRLFARGAVAYWMADPECGATVLDAIGRVAQCVLEVRTSRFRVTKAEGRPRRLQGSTASFEIVDGGIRISERHTVGRLGDAIRRVRRDRNLTQSQLARLAGVTPAAISQTELGRRGLSLDTIVRMCEALGIGVDDLLETSRPPDPLLARFDATDSVDRSVALFADAAVGPRTYLVRLGPGESAPPPFPHKGPELVLAASGLILVDLGDTTPVLRAGDALRAATTPIRSIANLAEESSSVFWQAIDPAPPPVL